MIRYTTTTIHEVSVYACSSALHCGFCFYCIGRGGGGGGGWGGVWFKVCSLCGLDICMKGWVGERGQQPETLSGLKNPITLTYTLPIRPLNKCKFNLTNEVRGIN